MKIKLSIIAFFAICLSAFAQTDSLNVTPTQAESVEKRAEILVLDSLTTSNQDSIPTTLSSKKSLSNRWRKNYPNPKVALFSSLILPGTGQLYNKKYWKVPIVYGGLAALIYVEQFNVKQYRKFKRNYKASVDGDPLTVVDSEFENATSTQLRDVRNQAQRNAETTAFGIGLFYIFVAADTYVDAHLASFDVSDDLSLRLKPSFENNTIGLGVALSFR